MENFAHPGTRNNAPVVDLPGVQLRFAKADTKQAATRGRVLDHIGFDVKNHAAFVKKIQTEGIKLDEPVRTGGNGNTITYITDPWGTRIEIIQRTPLGPEVKQPSNQPHSRSGGAQDSFVRKSYMLSHRGLCRHSAFRNPPSYDPLPRDMKLRSPAKR